MCNCVLSVNIYVIYTYHNLNHHYDTSGRQVNCDVMSYGLSLLKGCDVMGTLDLLLKGQTGYLAVAATR